MPGPTTKATAISAPPSRLRQKAQNVGYEVNRALEQFPLTRLLGLGDSEAYGRPAPTLPDGTPLAMGEPMQVDQATAWPSLVRNAGGDALSYIARQHAAQQAALAEKPAYQTAWKTMQERYPRLTASLDQVRFVDNAGASQHSGTGAAHASYIPYDQQIEFARQAQSPDLLNLMGHELTHHADVMRASLPLSAQQVAPRPTSTLRRIAAGPRLRTSKRANAEAFVDDRRHYAVQDREQRARRQGAFSSMQGAIPEFRPRGKAAAALRSGPAQRDADLETMNLVRSAQQDKSTSPAHRAQLEQWWAGHPQVTPLSTWDWVKSLLPW